MTARLGYRFAPKADLNGPPTSLADYEYTLFGGAAETGVSNRLRRSLPFDLYGALRDAARDLGSWRKSPLRPLIEQLENGLDDGHTSEILGRMGAAQAEFVDQAAVSEVADRITARLIEMAGAQHGTTLALGLASFRRESLLRELRLLIDGGNRDIGHASSGTANLLFFALKSLELDLLVTEGERDHTFLGVEEPEAHLHPHIQRLLYKYLLHTVGTGDGDVKAITPILTTHSPQIASVAPLRSVVLLRRKADSGSVATSTAQAPLTDYEVDDLQRYIDVTRGELFFARAILFVEGDAERFLIPVYAEALGIDLDALGITVSSVAGTNFRPYAKLVGTDALDIPFAILTDRDPRAGVDSYAKSRVLNLLADIGAGVAVEALTEDQLYDDAAASGIFVNGHTLEIDLFFAGLGPAFKMAFTEELNIRQRGQDTVQGWIDDLATLDTDALLKTIDRIGKGRLAQRLASHVTVENCPPYIRAALEYLRDAVTEG